MVLERAHAALGATIRSMLVEKNAPLQSCNTFGIAAHAHTLVRIRTVQDIHAVRADPHLYSQPFLVLGAGSNVICTGDVTSLVLKMEIGGMRLLHETATAWIVEAGAGQMWHDVVAWTLAQGWPGLENLALIPGTVGAAPVQNIGAYGVELRERFHSLLALDWATGQPFTLDAAQCAFGYRDSVFKHGTGWAGRAIITHVRLSLPKAWRAQLGYVDLAKKCAETCAQTTAEPSAAQIFEWVCAIRRAKLPDPAVLGNAGSFFKNPTISPEQYRTLIAREPNVVCYPMADGRIKLAAGWLIDACGWKGKSIGRAGVYEKQALVLVNRGTAHNSVTGAEVMALARAIQTSVYARFGVALELEPVLF